MNEPNPRGFAYKTFHRAYDNLSRWSWFVTMRANHLAPSRNEYVLDCLGLWDKMHRGETEIELMHDLAWSIVKWRVGSLREEVKGTLSRPRPDNRWVYWKKPTDFTDSRHDINEYEEPGFGLFDDADALASRLKVLSKHLTATQLEMVGRFVQMEAPTFTKLATDLGYHPNYVSRVFINVRATAERIGI